MAIDGSGRDEKGSGLLALVTPSPPSLAISAAYQPFDAGVGGEKEPLGRAVVGDGDDENENENEGQRECAQRGENDVDDADLYGNDRHDQLLVPRWRARLRRRLLRFVIADTPRLAWLQRRLRSPFWDHYFTYMSTLGTHTFFLVALPLFVWIGRSDMTQRFVWVLGSGVYVTGVLKDLVCVPRPFSPPLTRLTVGTHHLEYGFPSTHSTNAIGIALVIYDEGKRQGVPVLVGSLCFIYAFSVAFGRLYCGMHTTLDVTVGLLVGYVLYHFYERIEVQTIALLASPGWWPPFIFIPIAILLVAFHPEPIDNCPCFEDSVAFVGTQVGLALANWTRAGALAKRALSGKVARTSKQVLTGSTADMLRTLGPIKLSLRVVVGLTVILVWRLVAKKFFQIVLPPIFRAFFPVLKLPRRHYVPANEHRHYTRRDTRSKALKTVPSILDLPAHSRLDVNQGHGQSLETSAHPDAYLRYRSREGADDERRRRGEEGEEDAEDDDDKRESEHELPANGRPSTRQLSHLRVTTDEKSIPLPQADGPPMTSLHETILAKPRPPIHFDIDVLTKLFVYSGVAWWAMDGTMRVFEQLGLV